MTELLDTIDEGLQEVEEQLLQEFDRIRNTLSDSQLESIDPGVKNALGGVVDEMRQRLDQSGDRQNLQLMTEQHEILHSRIVVLRQLLNAKVPTAFLHEAHSEVKSSRKELESRVIQRRHETEEDDGPVEKGGLFGKIKGLFSGGAPKTEKETARNRIDVTEEEAKRLEPVTIYLDNGIYSASRELSALANIFKLPAQQQNQIKEEHTQRITGKAEFGSRDLSNQPAPSKNIAQTPDAIRAKLADRQGGGSATKASFGSKDIEHVKAKERPQQEKPKHQPPTPGPTTGKALFASRDIAHEQPHQVAPPPKKKEPAPEPTPTTGKATFASKDIEPIAPQEFRGPRKKEPEPQPEEEKPKTGKAVFESRDLSKPKP